MSYKVCHESKRMDWETPNSLFDELDKEFHFTLDACASKDNAKCANFFSIEDNSLVQNWAGGGCSILQPAIRKTNKQMGQESI